MSSYEHNIDIGARVGATLRDFGALAPQAERILRTMMLELRREMLNIWPEDTGTSRANWDIRIDGMILVFQNPTDYTSWVRVAGDETPIVDFLEARAEELAAAAVAELRTLLARVPAQRDLLRRPSRAPDPVGRARAAALFATQAQLFQETGARARLRQRFPAEPIGRARTRVRRR